MKGRVKMAKYLTYKFMSYDDYLQSDEWKEKRMRILKRDGFQCRYCGTGMNLVVHHINYPEELGTETDDDLITVCETHHKKIHEGDLSVETILRTTAEDRLKNLVETRIEKGYLAAAESRAIQKAREEATIGWINENKTRDFLYGGNENMCRLDLLKESYKEYADRVHCEPFGVTHLQVPLGFGHRMLVNELYNNGYSIDEIALILPFDKAKIQKYLKDENLYWNEEKWSYYLPWQELKAKAEEFVRDDQYRRRGIDND